MKRIQFKCLIALFLLNIVSFVSCQKIEPIVEEQTGPVTQEEILMGLNPECIVDSYSITEAQYSLIFKETASYRIRDNKLTGSITQLNLKKDSVKSFNVNKNHITITLLTEESTTLNYSCPIEGNFEADTKVYFKKGKDTAEIQFFVKYNSEQNINFTLKENEYASIETEKISETIWNVVFTNKLEEMYSTRLTIVVDNGVSQKEHCLDVNYFDIIFEGDANETETIPDGKEHWVEYKINTNIPVSDIHLSITQDHREFNEDQLQYSLSEDNVLKFLLPENFALKTCTTTVSIFSKSFGVSTIRRFLQSTYGSTSSGLMAFYNATDGENWAHNENFGNPNIHLSDWGSVQFSGYGRLIRTASAWCEKLFYYNEYVTLGISARCLHGYFPDEFYELEKLEVLDLYFEDGWITKPISPNISKLKNLEVFHLEDLYTQPWEYQSGMDLEIIDEIWRLPNLQVVNLVAPSRGSYKVNWDSVQSLPTNLHCLSLDCCDFGKEFELNERLFENNDDLMVFKIGHCDQLIGNIPDFLGEVSKLVSLELTCTSLSGAIPASLGDLKELVNLDLSENKLSGEIPESLGFLPDLELINLSGNYLTGEIPESFINISCIKDKTMPVSDIYYKIARQKRINANGQSEFYELPCPEWIKNHYGVNGWGKENN